MSPEAELLISHLCWQMCHLKLDQALCRLVLSPEGCSSRSVKGHYEGGRGGSRLGGTGRPATAGRRASLRRFHCSPQPCSPAAAQRPHQTPYSHLTERKQKSKQAPTSVSRGDRRPK